MARRLRRGSIPQRPLQQNASPSREIAQFRSGRFSERAEDFAKTATEKGEQAASVTMDWVANAFDIAARNLREAAERLKTRQ